jgi:hypothetical protein
MKISISDKFGTTVEFRSDIIPKVGDFIAWSYHPMPQVEQVTIFYKAIIQGIPEDVVVVRLK